MWYQATISLVFIGMGTVQLERVEELLSNHSFTVVFNGQVLAGVRRFNICCCCWS